MGGQDDLGAALKVIMAAKREELGDAPSPEELLAYRDGRLQAAERQRIEAKIAVYPDAARALADLAAFPAVEAAAGTPELSAEEVDARWQKFRQRLATLPAPVELEGPRARAEAPAIDALAGRRSWQPAWRLAAGILVALGLGWLGGFFVGRGSLEREVSAINVKIAEVAPEGAGELRSPVLPVEMPAGSEELVLVLGAPLGEVRDFPTYEAEVIDLSGHRMWSRQGLRATPLGTYHLAFRRAVLRPGRFQIRLFGRAGKSRVALATYPLHLVFGAAGP